MTGGRIERHWTLDKSVNISMVVGLILALLSNFGFASWEISKLDSRVSYLEDSRLRTLAVADRDQTSVRLARVEENVKSVLEVVRRLDSHIAAPPARE